MLQKKSKRIKRYNIFSFSTDFSKLFSMVLFRLPSFLGCRIFCKTDSLLFGQRFFKSRSKRSVKIGKIRLQWRKHGEQRQRHEETFLRRSEQGKLNEQKCLLLFFISSEVYLYVFNFTAIGYIIKRRLEFDPWSSLRDTTNSVSEYRIQRARQVSRNFSLKYCFLFRNNRTNTSVFIFFNDFNSSFLT